MFAATHMHTSKTFNYLYMHVLLKRMAHSLFIIFVRVFSYVLISFILLWSFCKVAIIVLKDATFDSLESSSGLEM